MNKRSASIAKWLTLGILTAAACDPMQPLADTDEDIATDDSVRTAQTARPPSLTKVEPAAVLAGSDGELTITGKGFVPGLQVTVGGLPTPTPRVVTSTKIQVALPPGLAIGAAVSVRITLPDGRYGERSDLFAVAMDPVAANLVNTVQRYPTSDANAPVVADFNGDGRPDIAALSTGGITLQLSNSGFGMLTEKVGPAMSSPRALLTADVNKDGRPDLVVTTTGYPSQLSVFVGNGDGTFKAGRPVDLGSETFSDYQSQHLAAGDVNGDGKVDLAVGFVSGSVYLYPGNGDGTFSARSTIATGTIPVRSVRIGDFDGNSSADVLVTTGMIGGSSGSISTLIRQTDGTFKNTFTGTTSDTIPVGGVLDFDGDGKQDIAVVTYAGKLRLYRGNGDGTFGTEVSSDVGTNSSFLLIGDLNGDGKSDLVSGGRFDSFEPAAQTFISITNTDGTTRTRQFEPDGKYSSAALSDISKDGRSDLILTSIERGEVSLVYGRGDGSFVLNPTTGTVNSVATGDWNGDGKLDVVYVGSSVNKLGIMLGRSDGSFDPPKNVDVDRGPSAVRSGDFDGDGKLDVAVTCYDANLVSLLLGKGDGTFATQRTFSVGKGPNSLAVVDLDGDSKLDIVTANTEADTISVLIGNGTGNFATSKDYSVGKAPISVAAAELSGDGRIDVVTANADANTVSYLQGSAVTAGVLNVAKSYSVGQVPSDLALMDTSGDGKLDIVTLNSDSSNVAVLTGRGDGTFASAKLSATCEFPTDFSTGELTGDGKVDLMVRCASAKRSQALIGQGDGSFISSPRIFPLGTATLIADVNADSKSDLLLFDSDKLPQVLLNARK
jgi:hypothetical protein